MGDSEGSGVVRKRRRYLGPQEIVSALEQAVDVNSESEADLSLDDSDLDPTYVEKVSNSHRQ